MSNKKWIRTLTAMTFIIVAAVFLMVDNDRKSPAVSYHHNQGQIFGTYYNIRYSAGKDMHDSILSRFQSFDNSLSTFNPHSVISRINKNESDSTDCYFREMMICAQEVYQLSGKAFDPTVAPIVNLWGFGFRNKEEAAPEKIDSLLQYVGFDKVSMAGERLHKGNPAIMLDASAIAKGQACDVIAALLQKEQCASYLVDIGGEVVCQGVNDKGEAWKVGINKPVDDPTGNINQLQEIIQSSQLCMATSGNYRQYYYENGQKRSHTIDPRTGYPVQHNLLSATVIAPTCMQATHLQLPAWYWAKSSLQMIEQLDDAECYLIYAADNGNKVVMTDGMQQYIAQ